MLNNGIKEIKPMYECRIVNLRAHGMTRSLRYFEKKNYFVHLESISLMKGELVLFAGYGV